MRARFALAAAAKLSKTGALNGSRLDNDTDLNQTHPDWAA
jgi:hypothetical protein